jgi:hypothetical protein
MKNHNLSYIFLHQSVYLYLLKQQMAYIKMDMFSILALFPPYFYMLCNIQDCKL